MAAPRPHAIPRTEDHLLRATAIDQEYRISVALPRGYDSGDRRYPILLVLDADMGFGTLVEGHRLMSINDGVDDIIIVGIGYPVDDFLDTVTPRMRDLTPTIDREELEGLSVSLGEAATAFIGGAARFLDFIRLELMPLLVSSYRVDPMDVGIAGASFGGLFGAWCLLERSGTFSRFLLGSPSLGWDDGVVFRWERGYWSRSHELAAQVFLSVGSRESPEGVRLVRRLSTTLRRRRYRGLRLVTQVFPGEAHGTVVGGAMWRGVRELYPRPAPDD